MLKKIFILLFALICISCSSKYSTQKTTELVETAKNEDTKDISFGRLMELIQSKKTFSVFFIDDFCSQCKTLGSNENVKYDYILNISKLSQEEIEEFSSKFEQVNVIPFKIDFFNGEIQEAKKIT